MATADTIAIKCPGCQAGFDVPTGLAGKTIRCTSCKTQLPVPAATNGRAKAGPLPTAKTAPRGPSGPPARSAADLLPKGGKPNRPRDDDDDDDDDRPARRSKKKKAASGGGSAMPLILAGVAVVVLAGGGIGAYFAFKKDTPAAASGSTTTPPPTDGGPKGGPGRGMAPPGPAGTASSAPAAGTVAADGWVTHAGDGFIIDFPGGSTPKQKTVQLGNGVTITELEVTERDDKGGFTAGAVVLPAGAGQADPKLLLNMALEGLTKGPNNGANGPTEITNKSDITLDGAPGYDLTMRPAGKAFNLYARLVAAHGRVFVAACGHETDPAIVTQAARFLGSLRISAPGEQVATNTPNENGGRAQTPPGGSAAPGSSTVEPGAPMPGPPPRPGPPPGPGGMTFPMPGPPPGPGGMTTPMPGPPPGPGGMTFPMPGPPPGPNGPRPGPPPGPGGPPPGPGFPMPGGTPGFAGSSGGGFVTPALATQITPFFTIAFDTEKAEVFTVSIEQVSATKANYKLNRYTYPAFIPKGEWKIPTLGVRAALDSAGQKLYLAAAPLNAATFGQKSDRIAGTGDIAVYDLTGIRSGKVAERTELKPAATISTATPVRGLDVSADGKVLTVLLSRAPVGGKAGKANLRQYDTADRKQIKDKELPNAAWELARSADGNRFFVVEDPRAASQSVVVCDATTLEPRPMSLPKGTTDVAFGPDGKMVAASGATGGQAGELTVMDAGAAPKKLLATASRKNQNGYARFTPDGKKLLVSSHGLEPQSFGPGLDVYDVTDAADPTTYKKVATVRSAGLQYVGGYFHLSPDGERVVIQSTGAVLETAKLAEHVGGPEPPGLEGGAGGVGPMGPGGVGPMPMGPAVIGPAAPGGGAPMPMAVPGGVAPMPAAPGGGAPMPMAVPGGVAPMPAAPGGVAPMPPPGRAAPPPGRADR